MGRPSLVPAVASVGEAFASVGEASVSLTSLPGSLLTLFYLPSSFSQPEKTAIVANP